MILVDAEKLGILLATVQNLHRKIDTLSTHTNAGANSSNLSTKEAACQYLGVNRRTLLNWNAFGSGCDFERCILGVPGIVNCCFFFDHFK